LTCGALAITAAAILTGCDPNAIINPGSNSQQASSQPESSSDANYQGDDSQPEPVAEDLPVAVDDPGDTSTGGEGEMIREAVHAGVGEKGHLPEGMLTSSGNAYWRSQAKIAFAQVAHDIQLFKARTGKAPQSHEEFMKEIIEPAQIKLPQLPPGQRYIYQPETEQLMIERPKG
jgi:hypothetical protein